jgi:hypothetical protein
MKDNDVYHTIPLNSSDLNESPTPTPSLTYKEFKKLMGIGLPSAGESFSKYYLCASVLILVLAFISDIVIVLLLCMAVFGIAHIIMEVWMTRLLLKAASHVNKCIY